MKAFVRLGIILLASFLLIGFVDAADSSSEAEFNIAGCTFEDTRTNEFFGVNIGECSAGRNGNGQSYTGMLYCNGDQEGWLTDEVNLGCSRGSNSFTPGTPEGACCPSGYFCDSVGSEFQCKISNQNCLSTMTETLCESLEVDGYYYNGECVCERSEQSCDIYTTESACGDDDMNIGSVGIGRSEYCGGWLECGGATFSVPSCGCSWNSNAGPSGACEHSIAAVESFPTGVPTSFECSSSYDIGECLDGSRDVSWTSIKEGDVDDVPEECFKILGCNGGNEALACGENFVKLPGFSLFSLFMSLFVIGIYYFVLGRFKYKRNL